jgi:hypothetical protein
VSNETKKYDAKIITNTLVGLSLQTRLLLGLDMEYKQNTTLNELLSINRETLPDPKEPAQMRYLCVGNGGHAIDGSEIPTPVPLEHQPSDNAPYSIVPLVMRPVDKDLPPNLRENYALRRMEEHKGRRYWCYYLKRIDHRGVRVNEYRTIVKDGEKNIREYEHSDRSINPQPPSMPDYNYEVTDQVVPEDGDYLHSNARVRIEFTEFDVQELLNVAAIKYGDPKKAVVSEFCLTSGVDMVATGDSVDGSPFEYLECMGAQIVTHMTMFTNMAFANNGTGFSVDFGNTEPMAVAPGQLPQQLDSATTDTSPGSDVLL